MKIIILIGFFYYISIFLYENIKFLKKLLIQPSILCGTFLLILGPQGLNSIEIDNYEILKMIPGVLISFLFSGIVLSNPGFSSSYSSFLFKILRQGIFVWMVAILQLLMGCIISILFFGKNNTKMLLLSSIIEIGWIGGHGSASAFSAILKDLNISEIGDIAIISATFGLLWGSISGIILIHLLRIKNTNNNTNSHILNESQNFHHNYNIQNVIYGMFIVIVPVFIAYYTKELFIYYLDHYKEFIHFLEKLPLFFIVIIFAFLLKKILLKSISNSIDVIFGIKLISGIVLELLIISAIASLNLNVFIYSFDIIILYFLGGILSSIIVWILAPFFIDYHPELTIINYGMSTGTTGTGFMLLKLYKNIEDPIAKKAIIIYGSAAPLSAPFIGGGIFSLMIPLFIYYGYFWAIFIVLSILLCIFILLNLFFKNFENKL